MRLEGTTGSQQSYTTSVAYTYTIHSFTVISSIQIRFFGLLEVVLTPVIGDLQGIILATNPSGLNK